MGCAAADVARPHTFKATADFRVILNDMAGQAFAEGRKGLPAAESADIKSVSKRGSKSAMATLGLNGAASMPFRITTSLLDYIVALAKIKLETLMRLYHVHHGFDSYDIFMIRFLMFLGFMQVRALATSEAKESKDDFRSTVFLIAKGLRSQGQDYYLAEVVFNMMRDSLDSSDQRFLGTILNMSAEDETRRSLIAQHTRSVWPSL
ncbi:hypothetical protein PWT90_06411 [Aphanocladium album]|nr:hypothetical protein PWT90_06411 [Aphanocladium album]